MRSKLFFSVLILCILSPLLNARVESAFPFLLIGPSSFSFGLAGDQTALPTGDTFGFYYNPGQSGLFAASDDLSFRYLKLDWFPGFNFSDLYFTSHGISVGRRVPDTPFAVGLGYMRGYLNLGNKVWTDEQGSYPGEFHSNEWYDAFSLGISLNWYVNLSVGFTYKSIVSDLSPIPVATDSTRSLRKNKGTAHDFGLLLQVPLHELIKKDQHDYISENQLIPVADISFGMALDNIGEEMTYILAGMKEPLPRQAKIGMAVHLGFKYKSKDNFIFPVQISWTTEADDLLIYRNNESYTYQSFPGDINIQQNILNGKGDDQVINRHHSLSRTRFQSFSIKIYGI